MLHAMEQLHLEALLLRLEDIDRAVAEAVGEGVVDFGAGEEEGSCARASAAGFVFA